MSEDFETMRIVLQNRITSDLKWGLSVDPEFADDFDLYIGFRHLVTDAKYFRSLVDIKT